MFWSKKNYFEKFKRIKDHSREQDAFGQRIVLTIAFVLILFFLLFLRLWYLQIYHHTRYSTLSFDNRVTLLPIAPKRGLIYDRNGVLIAENIPAFSLDIIAERAGDLTTLLHELEKIISISKDEQEDFFKQLKRHRSFESIPLKLKLTEEEVAKISVNRYRFPGIEIHARLIRHYPAGALLAHVLGYVGRINEKELTALDTRNYSATHFVGKTGIEKYYEDILHGQVGHQEVETNAQGRIVRTLQYTPPNAGKNLFLTLDVTLQKKAFELLNHQKGAIVAINPQTGGILAMVSYPSFDPNLFVTGIDHKTFYALQTSTLQPLFNRAIRGQYPPGSTIKPIIALQGLEQNLITPDTKIFDPGFYQLKHDQHKYRDWTSHGWVDLRRSLIESCDTYYYSLAHKLHISGIDDIMLSFGFGHPLHLDTQEELGGLVPTPRWKKHTHHQPWYPGETLIAGIGQGFMLATPLQLAHGISTIASRGLRYQPHLMLATQDESSLAPYLPQELAPVSLSNPAHWQSVISAMQAVIDNPQGTAHRIAKDLHYKIAGKTGTAQVFSLKNRREYQHVDAHLRDHSLFVGFAPVKNPEIAVAVIVENAPDQVKTSSIARQLMDTFFALNTKTSGDSSVRISQNQSTPAPIASPSGTETK